MRLRRRQLLCIIEALKTHDKYNGAYPLEHYEEALRWAEGNLKGRVERGPKKPPCTPTKPCWNCWECGCDPKEASGETPQETDNQTTGWLAAIHQAGEEDRSTPRDENGRVHAGFCVDCPTDENGRCLVHPEAGPP